MVTAVESRYLQLALWSGGLGMVNVSLANPNHQMRNADSIAQGISHALGGCAMASHFWNSQNG